MEFNEFDRIDDVAEGLDSLVTAVDELREARPPSLKLETIEELRRVLVDAARLVAELEDQEESTRAGS